ncbi:hypothetical protein YC2023_104804 [Brassica napus]
MANFFNHSILLRFSNLSNSKTVILPRNLDLSTWRFPEEHKDANPNFKKRRSFSKYGDGRSSKTDPSYKNRLRSPRFSDDPQKNTRTSSPNFKKQVTFTARFSDDPQVVFICGGMSESPQISGILVLQGTWNDEIPFHPTVPIHPIHTLVSFYLPISESLLLA